MNIQLGTGLSKRTYVASICFSWGSARVIFLLYAAPSVRCTGLPSKYTVSSAFLPRSWGSRSRRVVIWLFDAWNNDLDQVLDETESLGWNIPIVLQGSQALPSSRSCRWSYCSRPRLVAFSKQQVKCDQNQPRSRNESKKLTFFSSPSIRLIPLWLI